MKILGGAVLMVVFIVLVGVVMALPVWLLWNWLMPDIFGLVWLTFMQALGVSVLASILFKGSSGSSSKS